MIIFSTCWYCFKAKFDYKLYKEWIDTMLSNVNNYYLVIYTDKASYSMVSEYSNNPKIKIVLKEIEEFYQYRHKDNWIKNHTKNMALNTRSGWEVNMLWAEKIHFVKQTVRDRLFEIDPEWYGWCDIGYFRPYSLDPRFISMPMSELADWPKQSKLDALDKTKIHYGLVNLNIMPLINIIKNKQPNSLPVNPIPPNQTSVAGGFFLLTNDNLEWWANTFDERLDLYFDNDYLVKDDQIIIIDCIITHINRFKLHREDPVVYDNWFMFQRILN